MKNEKMSNTFIETSDTCPVFEEMAQNAITLMSLVITIIVMLILTGVVLSLTLGNNGIFKTAKMAAENYTNAQERELAEINSFTNSLENYGINDGENNQVLNQEDILNLVNQIQEMKKEIEELKSNTSINTELDKMYPVGSIYISTDLSTSEAVNQKIGGTWESYGQGRTLVGVEQNNNSGETGGSKTTTLTVANLPTHSHNIPSLSGTTDIISLTGSINAYAFYGSAVASGVFTRIAQNANFADTNGETHGTTTYKIDVSHSHTVTTNESTTGNVGNGTAVDVQDPYITVYMWKRVS